MSKKRTMASLLVMCVLTAGLCVFFQRLLMPKYMETSREGALIGEYYKEEKKHDVIFIGDCEVYENISPVTLWEQYGIPSYIRGSAKQQIWQSYAILEETLQYEKPQVVVFNVLSMKYGTPQEEAYNRMTLDGMKNSRFKWEAVKASMTEEETMVSYVFPILRFHSRWSDIGREDFRYFFHKRSISHNGYLMNTQVRPAQVMPRKERLEDYTLPAVCMSYLEKMTQLCKEQGVQLVLMKAPSIYPVWYDEWDAQVQAFAEKHQLLYVNFLNYMEETGVDLTTDTYDGGLHLNVYGAEKVADYFGNILQQTFDLPDRRQDAAYQDIWQEKTERYERERNGAS